MAEEKLKEQKEHELMEVQDEDEEKEKVEALERNQDASDKRLVRS